VLVLYLLLLGTEDCESKLREWLARLLSPTASIVVAAAIVITLIWLILLLLINTR
jgi:hypothetical protein